MLLINGKAMLKIGNRYIPPGEEVEVPEGLGKKLKDAGLATAPAKPDTVKPEAKPKAKPKAKRGKAGK